MTEQSSYPIMERGRATAFIAYALYLLSIPSAGILALVGLIVAYVGRDEATGAARTHIEEQIRVWWIAFWWGVAIVLGYIVGGALTVVLVGIPILILAWFAALVVGIWFTVKSLFGLIALLDGRPA